jgi:FtsP/CotA-like multicopper oxidase with cupredoxin domain
MYLNGSAMGSATNLSESALSPVPANPPPANATVTFNFVINQTEPTVWQINAQPFVDPIVPILFGNSSEGWTANTTYFVPDTAVVDLVLSIANDSLDTMGHPLHLHGHSFWVLGKGSGHFDASQLNTVNPPVRDTEGNPASGWLAIRYVADNPGAWIFHCHIDWYLPAHASINDRHLAAGMAVVLVEGEGQFPTIPANVLAVPSYI